MTLSTQIKTLLSLLFLTTLTGNAQDLPIYNNYFSNPFFYNPSYSNANKQTELNLLYRQQWSGLDGAPKFSFLTLTAPISKKMGFGINLFNNSKGVITTNSAEVSLSYKVQFDDHTYLSFGLSAGVGKNGLDVSQVDVNDPVIARVLSSSFFLEGQAGFNFQHRNLNIGFSLPQFFNQSIVSTTTFQSTAISPFNMTVASIGYKWEINPSFSIQPLLLSKMSSTSSSNQWEVYGIAYYKDAIWLGGLYRQNAGPALITGFQVSHILQVGYSYEFASSQISALNFNTHELRLSIRFGKESPTNQRKNRKGNNSPGYIRSNHYIKTHH